MKLTINKDGAVLLDDKEIDRVTRVDIKNIALWKAWTWPSMYM